MSGLAGHDALRETVVWHEVECGGYTADLPLWEEMAADANGPILDLGCGTGRVALHLARRGYEVTGLDSDPDLVNAFNERVGELPARAVHADARSFNLSERFALILAPMQLVQLFTDQAERTACLRCVSEHLLSDGGAAFALVEEVPAAEDAAPPLPDVREIDGWVYSSLPLDAHADDEAILIRRLRQTVSPAGELHDEENQVELRLLTAARLEHEAEEAGLRSAGRGEVLETESHVGSTAVLLQRRS